MPAIVNLLLYFKNKLAEDKNGENVSHFGIAEGVLDYFHIVNNDYQHKLRALYTFVPNKSFGSIIRYFN